MHDVIAYTLGQLGLNIMASTAQKAYFSRDAVSTSTRLGRFDFNQDLVSPYFKGVVTIDPYEVEESWEKLGENLFLTRLISAIDSLDKSMIEEIAIKIASMQKPQLDELLGEDLERRKK